VDPAKYQEIPSFRINLESIKPRGKKKSAELQQWLFATVDSLNLNETQN
jgi:hypothetical protein